MNEWTKEEEIIWISVENVCTMLKLIYLMLYISQQNQA